MSPSATDPVVPLPVSGLLVVTPVMVPLPGKVWFAAKIIGLLKVFEPVKMFEPESIGMAPLSPVSRSVKFRPRDTVPLVVEAVSGIVAVTAVRPPDPVPENFCPGAKVTGRLKLTGPLKVAWPVEAMDRRFDALAPGFKKERTRSAPGVDELLKAGTAVQRKVCNCGVLLVLK